MDINSKIYVAGHEGLVGSAVVRSLRQRGYTNIVLRSREQLNLLDQSAVSDFFITQKPEYVFLAAAKVGGLFGARNAPASFIYDNLQIQCNVIHHAYLSGVKKLLFLSSSCVYPKFCPQPMRPEHLFTGALEEAGQAYSVAKIGGIEMCYSYNHQYKTNFLTVIPATLYGPNAHFDPENSHVLTALIQRFHDAKTNNQPEVTLWGTGTPEREFLYVDDCADACIFLMNHTTVPSPDFQNTIDRSIVHVGTGDSSTIRDLAQTIGSIVGYDGRVLWDTTRLDGAPKKLLDSSKIQALGWHHRVALQEGIRLTYQWFIEH